MHPQSNGSDIDPAVQRLVALLNAMTGVSTISSCGGHPAPRTFSQVVASGFYVDLAIDHNRHGWTAITRLVEACDKFPFNAVRLKPWIDGDLRWDLRSSRVRADAFAIALESALHEQH